MDLDLISFFSKYPIDMIVATGTETIINSGATTNTPQRAFIVTSSVINTYKRATFVRAVWSIDGVNYQSLDSHLIYGFNITATDPEPDVTVTMQGLRAAISIGVSPTSIYFITANGYHGNVTQAGSTYTYTPISQTFVIKYALFEKGV